MIKTCSVVPPVTLKKLTKILIPTATSRWRMLAVNLELESGVISKIDKDSNNVEDKLVDVLNAWMDDNDPPNWSTIYQAVKDTSGLKHLAEQINSKFLK